jgi:hypothetical protein
MPRRPSKLACARQTQLHVLRPLLPTEGGFAAIEPPATRQG